MSSAPVEPIMLRPGEALCASGLPLAPGLQAIPCVADWNGDGLPDLVVGYRDADKVAVFLNCGTASQPAFTNFTNLQAAGKDIWHASAGCGAPAPWVCDFDADGRRDLLVGTGIEGCVYFYRNTNTDACPLLTSGVRLLVGGAPLSVPARATPYLHDWDEDGLADLMCGAGDGYAYLFKNVGTAQSPAYAAAVRIQAGGTDLNAGLRSAVRVCDWDGDGLKDLLCSGSDNACWCRNVGSNRSPILQAPVRLRAPVSGGSLAPIDTSYRMRLEVVDWNHDGVADVLVGDSSGLVYYYEGYHFAFIGIASGPAGGCVLQWNSAPYLSYNVLGGPSPDKVESIIAASAASGGKTTRWTNHLLLDRQFYRLQVVQ